MKTNKNIKTPYKDIGLFISEIYKFLKDHNTTVYNHANRISDYFEMTAYNSIVKYYQNNNFIVKVQNQFNNEFRYKLSPKGYPNNFSYFQITKNYQNKSFQYEIHHNLAIESARSKEIFTTPDISVIKLNSIKRDDNFYLGDNGYYYVPNDCLITFCEVKNFTPFPELLFNYIGTLNELHINSFNKNLSTQRPYHIAPSLLISGSGNFHTNRIKDELESRYYINIFFSLFYKKAQIYSKNNKANVKTIGTY